MTSTVDDLRRSRRNPAVLKLKILKVRGEAPDVLIFVYEGIDDVPIYEEWMAKIAGCPRFEPIAGAGKRQLVELHNSLRASGDKLIEHVFFFVDRDFDRPLPASDHMHELSAYSVENFICTAEVIESILKDEFRQAGSVAERASICGLFDKAYKEFLEICRPIDFLLFQSQRLGIPVTRRPEKIADITVVALAGATPTFASVEDVVELERSFSLAGESLQAEFDALTPPLQHRGKFSIFFLRRWLRLLSDDARSAAATLFKPAAVMLPGDPSSCAMRRFASAVPVPATLPPFVLSAANKT